MVVIIVFFILLALIPIAALALSGKWRQGLFGLGLIGVAGTVGLLAYASSMKRWPTVLAKVELLTLWEMTSEGTGYSIAIRYRYIVGGTEYTGTSLNLVDWTSGYRSSVEKELESLQSRVDEHGRILIHHHPTQPHRSVVNAGVGMPELAFLAGMVVWTSIVGLVMLL